MKNIPQEAVILAIDTATDICSLALLSREGVVAERIERQQHEHAALIARFADELVEEAVAAHRPLVALAVSGGPGSYTGLRIGASFAKGYCFAQGLPLLAISTLEGMAWGAIEQGAIPADAFVVSMLDAGRMEVYSATYTTQGECREAPHAQVITAESYRELSQHATLYLVGNGAAKCRETLNNPALHFFPNESLAAGMRIPAWRALDQERYADIAYWVPDYIKPYQAVIAKNKVLNR